VLVGALDSTTLPHLAREAPEVPWLGAIGDLRRVVQEQCVDEIFLALPVRSCFDQLRQAQSVGRDLGLTVSFELDLLEDMGPTVARLEGHTLEVSCNRHAASHAPGRQIKRAIDVSLGALALLASAPLFALAAIAIKLTSPGPVFFRQVRIGRGGRAFLMLKFRTMVENAEDLRGQIQGLNQARGASFKIFRDPRTTRLGRLMRRTSLDELPQLWNVLRGEMSLVGPRPVPAWVAERLPDTTFHRRLSVLPGITGLWQVTDRRQDFDHMARLDLRYVDDWSVWLDLRILAATVPAILGARNAY